MIGADVKNGLWAIYGAREGLYKTMCTDWNYVQVRDFECLNAMWNDKNMTKEELNFQIHTLGEKIIEELDIPIAVEPLSKQQSKFFKTVYENPSRTDNQRFTEKL